MNKAVHSSSAETAQPAAPQLQRRRFGVFVAALAAAGVSGCVVVPARPVVVPVRARVRVRV
ncbi:MAG TPA: hypothetical protein VLA16_01395 [Ideonella sp.]|nr:hypothetical protein [Ideonella sp.]